MENLSIPVILGCDYLVNNGFVLNFKQGIFHRAEYPSQVLQLQPAESTSCQMITIGDDCPQAILTRCKDPSPTKEDTPSDVHSNLIPVLEFKEFFHDSYVRMWVKPKSQSN